MSFVAKLTTMANGKKISIETTHLTSLPLAEWHLGGEAPSKSPDSN